MRAFSISAARTWCVAGRGRDRPSVDSCPEILRQGLSGRVVLEGEFRLETICLLEHLVRPVGVQRCAAGIANPGEAFIKRCTERDEVVHQAKPRPCTKTVRQLLRQGVKGRARGADRDMVSQGPTQCAPSSWSVVLVECAARVFLQSTVYRGQRRHLVQPVVIVIVAVLGLFSIAAVFRPLCRAPHESVLAR